MKVKLINYTQDALEMLIFSKKTRLLSKEADLDGIKMLSEFEKLKELGYIKGTINSSWEFVDYIFLITDVTRAFTHQLVRHRVGVSFAQMAHRIVDASDFDYLATDTCLQMFEYHEGMQVIKKHYKKCLEAGADVQDARGLLPTNVLTNILFKANLRALNTILGIRLCYKTQGEFQDVARKIREEVIKIHSWAEPLLEAYCVNKGICAFPNYIGCPIKETLLDTEDSKTKAKEIWANVNQKV